MKKIIFETNLKLLMAMNSLTQEELAEKCNVSRQTVGTWRSGKRFPSIDDLGRLCDIFNVTLDEIVYGSERLLNDSAILLKKLEEIQSTLAAMNKTETFVGSLWDEYLEDKKDNFSSQDWMFFSFEAIDNGDYEQAVYCMEQAFIYGDISVLNILLKTYWDMIMIKIYGVPEELLFEDGVEPIPLKEQYDIYEAFGARLKEYGMILEAEMLKAKEEF